MGPLWGNWPASPTTLERKSISSSTVSASLADLFGQRARHPPCGEAVEVDQRRVPSRPGTSLYIRPMVIATETFLGVRPSSSYLYYVILCPVGEYYKEGMNPVRILASDQQVRAIMGGLGAAKTAGGRQPADSGRRTPARDTSIGLRWPAAISSAARMSSVRRCTYATVNCEEAGVGDMPVETARAVAHLGAATSPSRARPRISGLPFTEAGGTANYGSLTRQACRCSRTNDRALAAVH
jgi:hypothetical protein